jgi:hypothetical protein
MSNTRISLLVLFLISFGIGNIRFVAFPPLQSEAEVSSAEYAVYSAVLKQRYSSTGVIQFVIEDHTLPTGFLYEHDVSSHFKYVKKRLPSLSQAAFNNFRIKNTASQPLQALFQLKFKYVLLSRVNFESLAGSEGMMEMSEVGWKKFYSDYPGASGFLSFSRVGFDHKTNQALVFVSDRKGHLSGRAWGDGSYVLLIKNKQKWRVKGRVAVMVS